KTIPRATLIGTLAAAAVYLLSTTAVFGAVTNAELQANDAAFAVAAENMFGSWAGPAVAVVAVISCLGAMNGLILLSGQIPMAAEFDGLAPKLFGKLNINRAPSSGLVVSAILAAIVLTLQYAGSGLGEAVATLVLVSAVATMIAYAFSAAAEIKWLLVDRGEVPVAHIGRKLLVAGIALAFTIFAFYGGGTDEIYWLFMIIMLGVPLYLYILWRRQEEDKKEHDADDSENFSI
ncbi:MAG: amino acid permease, partial [Halieaceae bacterium]|nr:amino acid permease [Halieaceae bacterium]